MSFNKNLPWTDHPTYSKWVFATDVYCISNDNLRFYFIRQPGDEPEICALVDGDIVVEEFLILNPELVDKASCSTEIELDGICLEYLELSISPDGQRYAFPHFKDGLPHIFVDGCSYEIVNKSKNKIARANAIHIDFSLDSTRLIAVLESWCPQNFEEDSNDGNDLDEENFNELENFDLEDEDLETDQTDEYYLYYEPASFYIEMNGAKRSPIARAGTLVWYEYFSGNKGLFGCRLGLSTVLVKAGAIPLMTGKTHTRFCFTGTYNNGNETMCISNSYSACSSDKRYIVFCLLSDDEVQNLYLIDTEKISSDDIKNSYSWCVQYPNVHPTLVFWKEDRFVVRYIKDQKPAILEIIV